MSEPLQRSGEGEGMYDFSILRDLRQRENLSLKDVSLRCGVSVAVISKLERNQTRAELETLFRLSRVFGMSASDLLALAESRTAQKKRETRHGAKGFAFRELAYANARCLFGTAPAGSRLSRPEVHGDDYEICWVLSGVLSLRLPHEAHMLSAGDALQFDAVLEHTYEAVKAAEFVIVHLRKAKRF